MHSFHTIYRRWRWRFVFFNINSSSRTQRCESILNIKMNGLAIAFCHCATSLFDNDLAKRWQPHNIEHSTHSPTYTMNCPASPDKIPDIHSMKTSLEMLIISFTFVCCALCVLFGCFFFLLLRWMRVLCDDVQTIRCIFQRRFCTIMFLLSD